MKILKSWGGTHGWLICFSYDITIGYLGYFFPLLRKVILKWTSSKKLCLFYSRALHGESQKVPWNNLVEQFVEKKIKLIHSYQLITFIFLQSWLKEQIDVAMHSWFLPLGCSFLQCIPGHLGQVEYLTKFPFLFRSPVRHLATTWASIASL